MINGIVQQIKTRPYGNKLLYSIKANNAWYGFGDKSPRFKEGDEVEFEFKTNPKGFNDVISATIKVVQASAGEQVNTNVPAAKVSNTKDDYWTRKEARDAKQDELREIGATRNTAIEFIRLLMDKECIKLPTKFAEREDFVKALLKDYVDMFRGVKDTSVIEDTASVDEVQTAPVETDKWS